MAERILLPTDGERGAEHAIEHALDLASTIDSILYALYVVDETVYGAYSGDEFVQEHEGPQSTLEERGKEALSEIAAEAAQRDIPIETKIRYGRPEEEIVAEADDIGADLVVIGSKTHPDEYRQLLGSVSERVLRLTDRPVTVVKTPIVEE